MMKDATRQSAISELARRIPLVPKAFAIVLACLLAPLSLPGCISLPARATAAAEIELPTDQPMQVRTLGADHRYSRITSGELAARLETLRSGEPVSILALSGGGAGGAFGAGAIVGLTESGKRPQFAVVTGVSAGALIAPYAFLGPAWDRQLMKIYTSGSGEHVLQSRGLGALFGSSMYRGTPLKQLVDRYATDAMIQAIAHEAEKGRLLLVATTDVNTAEPVLWDLGAIAMHGGQDARALFRDVLVASASVPGMFPPVLIDNETHVDGAVTLPFFIAPSPADISHDSTDRARTTNLYVLIDGQLSEPPHITRLRTTSIVSRSVAAGMNQMLRTTLELTASTAEQRGIGLEYSAIPMSYPYRGAFDFSAATVGPLFRYAYDCARAGRLWTPFRAAGDATVAQGGQREEKPPCPADDVYIERFAGRQH